MSCKRTSWAAPCNAVGLYLCALARGCSRCDCNAAGCPGRHWVRLLYVRCQGIEPSVGGFVGGRRSDERDGKPQRSVGRVGPGRDDGSTLVYCSVAGWEVFESWVGMPVNRRSFQFLPSGVAKRQRECPSSSGAQRRAEGMEREAARGESNESPMKVTRSPKSITKIKGARWIKVP